MVSIHNFIEKLLDFGTDWEVYNIEVNERLKEVDIFIRYKLDAGFFPGESALSPVYDLNSERRVRHLDLFDYVTYVNYRVPRIKNKSGEVRQIEMNWIGSRVSYTCKFEDKVIDTLLLSKNQTRTSEYMKISFDVVHSIMKRAVERGLKRRKLDYLPALSLDEKSIGSGHNYITVLSDPFDKRVLDIIEGRKQEDAEELITWTVSPEMLDKVEYVTMDMWDPYMSASKEVIPNGEIVHDKFHIAKILNKAVDDVRKREVKDNVELKNTKYLFPRAVDNFTENQKEKFRAINSLNLNTSQAWKIKENFKGIYLSYNNDQCIQYFKEWYIDVINLNINEMIKSADTMLRHLRGIVNACVSELSNSVAECLNAQIQTVKTVARGFKNVEGYRNAILFFQGKLHLHSL